MNERKERCSENGKKEKERLREEPRNKEANVKAENCHLDHFITGRNAKGSKIVT